jgi:ATPase subunit of ABC transporter with duplicated ATPase domains
VDAMQRALDTMAEVQAQLDTADAGAIDRRVDKVMAAMGFAPNDAEAPVSSFSGGWKMRIGLAKTLLQEPQVLLLDEPTNHMDLESVEWLEKYLQTQTEKLALVIVSHDREFLDRVCTKIVETNQGVAYSYNGNYRAFLDQKKEREALQMERWERQQKQIRELKQEISQLGAIESQAVTARQKERQLKEIDEGGPEHVPRPFVDKKKFSFRFPPAPRSGKEVIAIEGVSHGYGDTTLFRDVDLLIERGDRIAIIGPNGAGKTTLLKLIMGIEQPRQGTAGVIGTNAEVHFFEQDQANVLPLENTVLQTMEDAAHKTDLVYEQIRALLGKFMFKAEKVEDKLSTLSGGEKARVALCRMMVTPSNVLILDEPTNHLDIGAKEVLEDAIQNFEGTVLMVSHDRYFVSQTANTILAVEGDEVVVYDGDYRSYMEQHEDTKAMVEGRYIEGQQKIRSAPVIEVVPEEQTKKKKKNFGGKGGPSGNKNKGVKNAKRATALKG